MKNISNPTIYFLKKALLVCIILASYTPVFSQDTSFVYFDKSWLECDKDTAFYYSKTFKQDNLWAEKYYWVNSSKLYRNGNYIDKECKIGQGPFTLYREDGTVKSTTFYNKGKAVEADYFYESGKKKGHILFTPNGSQQQGWDENGVEIPNYIVERNAMFPGGQEGWKAYLERNLDPNVAARANAPIGIYPVQVRFVVDKEGNLSNIRAIEVPAACKRCGNEAVRIIQKGPKWTPAIQDNHPVIFQATQYISWQVSNQ